MHCKDKENELLCFSRRGSIPRHKEQCERVRIAASAVPVLWLQQCFSTLIPCIPFPQDTVCTLAHSSFVAWNSQFIDTYQVFDPQLWFPWTFPVSFHLLLPSDCHTEQNTFWTCHPSTLLLIPNSRCCSLFISSNFNFWLRLVSAPAWQWLAL